MVLVTLIGSAALWAGTRGHALARGDTVDAPITLVPGDRNGVACSLPRAEGSYRCGYLEDGAAVVPPPAARDLIAPYMTTEGATYLIPGLFETAGVTRYLSNHPENVRFTARCRLRLIRFTNFYLLRFRPSDPWGDGAPAWIAEPLDCSAP